MNRYDGPGVEAGVTPSYDQMQAHLDFLFGHEPDGYFFLGLHDPTKLIGERRPAWEPRRLSVDELDEAAAFAAEENAKPGRSVFVRPAVFGDVAPFEHPTDSDFLRSRTLWAECDDVDLDEVKRRYELCKPNAVVVTSGALADGTPRLRAHYYWRLTEDDVVADGAEQAELNQIVRAVVDGDAVHNPSRLMRLAGSINWGWKDNRKSELCTLKIFSERPEYGRQNVRHAFAEYAAPAAPSGGDDARGMTGKLRTNVLMERCKANDHWHDNALRLVAHHVAMGLPDEALAALAPHVTADGYTVEETLADLHVMADGARAKGWGGEAAPEITPERVEEAAPAVTSELEWFGDIEPVLTDAYLVKGMLAANAMSVVYGPSNSGKTFFALDLAFHIATCPQWRGRRVNNGSVLYLAAEGGNGLANRVAALRRHTGLLEAPFAIRRAGLDLLKSEADLNRVVALSNEVRGRHPDKPHMIVVDTLSRVIAGGNENSPDDMTALIRNVDAIREATGAHILIVHHTGKDAARGARGHSSLRAATDTEIEIESEDDVRSAKVTKQRDYSGGENFPFKLRSVELGVDQDGDAVTSCVVEEDELRAPNRRPKGKWQTLLWDVLEQMIAEGGTVITPNETGYPQHPTAAVRTEILRKRFYGKCSSTNEHRAFSDAFSALLEGQFIGSEGGLVWKAH